MRRICYLSLLLLLSFITYAQQTSIKPEWLANIKTYYNGGTMMVNDIAVGDDGSVVAVGYFSNTVDFDPGPDTFTVRSTSKQDIFIAKYSKAGKLVYAYGFGGKDNPLLEQAYGVALDNDGNAYMTGNFGNTVDFDPGAGTALLTSASTEAFIASYDKAGRFRYATQVTTTGATVRMQAAKSIIVDAQHNTYLTGSFTGTVDFDPGANKAYLTSRGGSDIFFAKYDKNGAYKWAKRVGNSENDEGNKIVFDKSNHIVVAGYFSDYATDFDPGKDTAFLPNNDKEDIFFAKYDTAGNYLFAKAIGGPQDDAAASVAVGIDNSIAITGSFASRNVDFDPGTGTYLLSDEGRGDCFVAKYDSLGSFTFAFKIGSNGFGGDTDAGSDIDIDGNNNLIVVGRYLGSAVDFDPGAGVYTIPTTHDYDNFVAKYSSAGSFLFADGIGNNIYTNWHAYTYLNCVQADKAGNIITGGSFSDTLDVDPGAAVKNIYQPATTLLITKYAGNGTYVNSVQANNYFEYYNNTAYIQKSVVDEEGNVYVAGSFNGRFDFDPGPGVYVVESLADYGSSTFFAKYNKSGSLVYAKSITYGMDLEDIAVDRNQNFYLCGKGFNYADYDPSDTGVAHWNGDTTGASVYGYSFAKYNKNGDFVFAKGIIDGTGNSVSKAIAVDKAGNIYIAGSFSHKLDFDPGDGIQYLTPSGYADIFYSKYNPDGNYLFAYHIGQAATYNDVSKLKLNSEGNIILSGNFSGTNVDFNPGAGQFLLSSGKNAGGYIASYKSNGAFLRAIAITSASKDYYSIAMTGLSIDASDNMYIGGYCLGYIDFDPGTKKKYLPFERGLYIASYTKEGTLRFTEGSYLFNSETATISDVATDKNNNVYTAGYFRAQQIDADFGPDSAILVNEDYIDSYTSNTDLFLARYDSLGNYVYSYDFDGDSALGGNYAAAINIDKTGNLYYAGYGKTKIDFNPGPDSLFLQPSTLYASPFLVKYSQVTSNPVNRVTGADAITKKGLADKSTGVLVYPNPAGDYITITNLPGNEKTSLIINDAWGKEIVIYQHIGTTQYRCNVSRLPAGVYYVQVTGTGNTEAVKFVKK